MVISYEIMWQQHRLPCICQQLYTRHFPWAGESNPGTTGAGWGWEEVASCVVPVIRLGWFLCSRSVDGREHMSSVLVGS